MQATKHQKFDRCNFKTYFKKKKTKFSSGFFFKIYFASIYLMA